MHRLLVQTHVGVYRELVDEREVLVDGLYPQLPGMGHRSQLHFLAADEDLPLVGLGETGENLDQGRLARTIVSDQPEHLAFGETEVDPTQSHPPDPPVAAVLPVPPVPPSACKRMRLYVHKRITSLNLKPRT